jgi:hypothetical protein
LARLPDATLVELAPREAHPADWRNCQVISATISETLSA